MRKTVFILTGALLSSAHASQTIDDTLTAGKQDYEKLCVACHNATSTGTNRLAPPMFAVLNHYIDNQTKLHEFVHNMVDFVTNPSDNKSLMPGAVQQFGLMPKMGYNAEQITSIAKFLYQNKNDIVKPSWYQAPQNQPLVKVESQSAFLNQGKKLALEAKAILGKNLMTALNTSGPEGALSFCNENAIQLTEEVVAGSEVTIKRVSDLNRNPNNSANQSQLDYIKNTQQKISKQQSITPQLVENKDTMLAYYPIMTNTMCLQCHGVPNQDIKTTTQQKIKQLYPDDLATGYGENELRGIWVIEMPKQTTTQDTNDTK